MASRLRKSTNTSYMKFPPLLPRQAPVWLLLRIRKSCYYASVSRGGAPSACPRNAMKEAEVHISEGVLSAPVLAAGAVFASAGLYMGLKKLTAGDIALCGMMAALFFLASLVHVPVGLGNAHLLLPGLVGICLGWAAFPAIFVALALQALLFQYGGITVLGVNTASMGYAAVAAGMVFHGVLRFWPRHIKAAAFLAGASGILAASFITACALAFTDEGFMAVAMALFAAHLPIMLAEGLITMFAAGFIVKVKPDIFFACPAGSPNSPDTSRELA